MRIRTIKPEFWESDDITSLPIEDRLLFIGLWSYVDDHGRGRDEEHLIIAALFPRDMFANPRETVARVSRGLATLSEAGLIDRYEVNGRRFLCVTSWSRHQKVDKARPSKCPPPEEGKPSTFPQNGAIRESVANVRESVASTPEIVAPGTGEQGNRGTGEQGSSSPAIAADATTQEDGPNDSEREDVEAVCEHMAASVEERTGRRPAVTKAWRRSARLLIDKDRRPVEEIHAAIEWSSQDEFWRANILSVPTLRKQFDRLKLQAQRSRPQSQARSTPIEMPADQESWNALSQEIFTATAYRNVMRSDE